MPTVEELVQKVAEQRGKVAALQQEWHEMSGKMGYERTKLWKLECELGQMRNREDKQRGN